MNKIEEQIARFKKVDMWSIIKEVIGEEKEQLIKLVLEQQRRGETKSGIMPEYENDEYIGYKASIGHLTAGIRINLWDEGDFQSELDAAIKSNFIEIFSTDSKADMLEAEFSSQIYELNEEGMVELKAHILPIAIKRIRTILNY